MYSKRRNFRIVTLYIFIYRTGLQDIFGLIYQYFLYVHLYKSLRGCTRAELFNLSLKKKKSKKPWSENSSEWNDSII